MYVAIAGNIGAGKSSLTKILAKRYHLQAVYEAVDENPYLEDFYKDMKRFAFHSQIFFLSKRLEQHLYQVNKISRTIQDRTIYEDAAIFAQNLYQQGILEERDYNSYMQMYRAILAALRAPDLLIYLRADLKTLKHHISLRGRDYETNIDDKYLLDLNDLYEKWIASYDISKLFIVDANKLDFVKNPLDLAELLDNLERNGLSMPVL